MDASPLNKLPAELRNSIYRMVLVDESPVKVNKKSVLERTALLHTCAQIREEAKGIFYENAFHITCGAGDGKISAAWVKQVEGNLHGIPGITVTFEVSHAILRHLSELDRVFTDADSDVSDSSVDEEERDALAEAIAEELVKLLTDEALDLAKTLSTAVQSGAVPTQQLQVIKPAMSWSQLDGLGEANCLKMMHGLFDGLGTSEGDRMRAGASPGGDDVRTMIDQFLYVEF